jgi:hypothetical protein
VNGRTRMCHGKVRYGTENAAIRATIECSRKWGKPMRYYRCPICRKWHITSEVVR